MLGLRTSDAGIPAVRARTDPKELAGDRVAHGQERRYGLEGFELAPFEHAPCFQCFVKLFDKPAGAVHVQNSFNLGPGSKRKRRCQYPRDWLLALRTRLFKGLQYLELNRHQVFHVSGRLDFHRATANAESGFPSRSSIVRIAGHCLGFARTRTHHSLRFDRLCRQRVCNQPLFNLAVVSEANHEVRFYPLSEIEDRESVGFAVHDVNDLLPSL